MVYCGIDPGKDGAVAIIEEDGGLVLIDTPTFRTGKKREYDEAGMVAMLRGLSGEGKVARVALEKVASRPGQGVASMFSMGEGYGLWRGMIAALALSCEAVLPQRWRRVMLAGYQKAETPEQRKAQSVAHAQRLFPAHAVSFRGPRGGLLDGRADAALIADYLRRTSRQQPAAVG